jgi:hypothetical protein
LGVKRYGEWVREVENYVDYFLESLRRHGKKMINGGGDS